MKKLIIILLCLNACGRVFAQTINPDSPRYVIDGGINQVSVNNLAFNTWVINHYNKTENTGVSGFFDFTAIGKWDVNLHLSTANPLLVYSLEIGRRVTTSRSPIASYINLDFGGVDAMFNDLAPVNYTPTPDQQGQQLQLKSSNAYFGITSRNYFNRLQVPIGKVHQIAFVSGFYVKAGWLPFRKHWEYGYYQEDGTDGDGNTDYEFNGVRVTGISNINNWFVDAGFFIGFSFK